MDRKTMVNEITAFLYLSVQPTFKRHYDLASKCTDPGSTNTLTVHYSDLFSYDRLLTSFINMLI